MLLNLAYIPTPSPSRLLCTVKPQCSTAVVKRLSEKDGRTNNKNVIIHEVEETDNKREN